MRAALAQWILEASPVASGEHQMHATFVEVLGAGSLACVHAQKFGTVFVPYPGSRNFVLLRFLGFRCSAQPKKLACECCER